MISFKDFLNEKVKYKNKKPGKWMKRVGSAAGTGIGATLGWATHGAHGGMAGAAIGGAAGYKAGSMLSNIKRAAKVKRYLKKRSKRNR